MKFDFCWGCPDPLDVFKGPTSKGRMERGKRDRKAKGGEGGRCYAKARGLLVSRNTAI